MGKGIDKNTLLVVGTILVAIFYLGNQQAATVPGTGDGDVDICKLVDAEWSFTGQRRFLEGTALTAEAVRIIQEGSKMDLGQVRLNSGTQSATPGATYNLYYGENSTTYYTAKEVVKGPCEESTVNMVGTLCTIDTTPTITVFDEYGTVQTGSSATNIAIAGSESRDFSVRVRVSADQCYGNPSAEGDNAICFNYSTTYFNSVEANTGTQAIPYSISNTSTQGTAISCYKLPKLADNEQVDIPVTLEATSTDPTATNVTVFVEDIGFDLDADTLEEIWGFEDEDNNMLGANYVSANVYVT